MSATFINRSALRNEVAEPRPAQAVDLRNLCAGRLKLGAGQRLRRSWYKILS